MADLEPISVDRPINVLVVDDDEVLAETLSRVMRKSSFSVDTTTSGSGAFAHLARARYDAVLLDVHFDTDWRVVLSAAMELSSPPSVLMLSGRTDFAIAVDAMRSGAVDFLEKPIRPDDLIARIRKAVDETTLRRRPNWAEGRRKIVHAAAVGSAGMREALRLADRVANTPLSSAFIIGESGVGKEIIAERIHDRSLRRDGPFVRVNLAAIPESMFAAELFGSVKGAFTDAKRDRAGFIASADTGTLLLDEIGEVPSENQAKLLRVIEERQFFPVGSDRERRVNVRIIAATNRTPEEMLDGGVLRPDLFYRLGTIIHIPPLRERRDEIPSLANEFIGLYATEFGQPPSVLTPEALAMLQAHTWPGNIRELRNVMERAVMLCEGPEITPSLLALRPAGGSLGGRPPSSVALPQVTPNQSLRLDDVRTQALEVLERDHIVRVLELGGGSRARAAELLGISRSTLYEKLKRYGLD